MKLKSILFLLFLGLFSNTFGANVHLNPNIQNKEKNSSAKNMFYPGYCQIEIINNSYTDVSVFGTFDDGSSISFDIYPNEVPHYISLYYNYYCHAQMYITIQSPYYTVYSGWTNVNSTIRIIPYFSNQLKAELSHR